MHPINARISGYRFPIKAEVGINQFTDDANLLSAILYKGPRLGHKYLYEVT